MTRGEEGGEEGQRGMGKEENRVKEEKRKKEGGRERQNREGGKGKRGKGKGEKGRSQPTGPGRRQHLQDQPLDCGTQRSEKCGCQRQR